MDATKDLSLQRRVKNTQSSFAIPSMFQHIQRYGSTPQSGRDIVWLSLRNRADSLQSRRDFLRISGEQGRKRGDREARVACVGGSLKNPEPNLARNSRFALASRLPRLRPFSPEIRKKSRTFSRALRQFHVITLSRL